MESELLGVLGRLFDIQLQNPEDSPEAQLAKALQRSFSCNCVTVVWHRIQSAHGSGLTGGTLIRKWRGTHEEVGADRQDQIIDQIEAAWSKKQGHVYELLSDPDKDGRMALVFGMRAQSSRETLYVETADPLDRCEYKKNYAIQSALFKKYTTAWRHLFQVTQATKEARRIFRELIAAGLAQPKEITG